MKNTKSSNDFAKRVFKMCYSQGNLSEEALQKAISYLSRNPPTEYRNILYALRRLVRLDIEARTVTVESASALTEDESKRIRTALNQKSTDNLVYNYSVDPSLISGMRVKLGSQVLDGSLKSKINRITDSFN